MTVPASPTSFSFPKRDFLHAKLDEVLLLYSNWWIPECSVWYPAGLTRWTWTRSSSPSSTTASANLCGPARHARDRQRAANHQAALAASLGRESAAPAVTTSKFPGKGNVVGSGTGPTLPLPLKKGDVFPPAKIQTPVSHSTTDIPTVTSTTFSVASSESFTIPTSSSTFPQARLTPTFVASTNVRDEVLPEDDSDDDEDELLSSCGHCLQGFDSCSGPFYCPLCVKYYHAQCGQGHKCLSFKFP